MKAEKITISMVANATATTTKDANGAHIVEHIRAGKWRTSIEPIRRIYTDVLKKTSEVSAAKLAIDPLKKNSPGILWSGEFSSRVKPAQEKLVAHSGLLCADLDTLGERLPQVRAKLATSPHLWAMFTSPSGDGIKAVFRVPADAERHLDSFRAVETHVHNLTGEQIDRACKDVARLCFVSYDPDAVLNEGAGELLPLAEIPAAKTSSRLPLANLPVAPQINMRQTIAENILGPIKWETATHGLCQCPGQNLHTTPNGENDCAIDLDRAPTVHCFHDHCRGLLAGVNHELRSQIGKAERPTGSPLRAERGSAASEYTPNDNPRFDALPYTPPPLDLLPSALQDYVRAASESLEVDVSYILLPVLSAMGTAVGDSRVIQLKPGFVQPPIIWTAIIGRSGSKKSPALDEGTFPIRERERDFIRQNSEALREHENDLAEWDVASRKERGLKPTPPAMRTVLMDDLTLASLASALAENPRGLLEKKDELSHWFASFDQFTKAQGADVSRWLSLHTGVLFALDRKTDRERYRVFNPRVCIAGGIQPKTLRRCLTEDFFDRGLPARFLFACPPRSTGSLDGKDGARRNPRRRDGNLQSLIRS